MNRGVGVVGVMVAVLAALVGLTGCTGPDATPVPTVVAEPWACTGVPMRAIELMSGWNNLKAEEAGSWDESGEFYCRVLTQDDELILTVHYDFVPSRTVATDGTELPRMADHEGSVVLDGGGTSGGGYVYPFGDGGAQAQWWSGSQWLIVTLEVPAATGRDPVADAGALLVSMLPWAVGGQDPPQS